MTDKDFYALVKQLVELQERARDLGMFDNSRPLAACEKCGLEEDVTIEGLLITTRFNDRTVDCRLRFEVLSQTDNETHFRCPACGSEFVERDGEIAG